MGSLVLKTWDLGIDITKKSLFNVVTIWELPYVWQPYWILGRIYRMLLDILKTPARWNPWC